MGDGVPKVKSFSPGVSHIRVLGVKLIHLTLLDGVSTFPVKVLISVFCDMANLVAEVKCFSPGVVISVKSDMASRAPGV